MGRVTYGRTFVASNTWLAMESWCLSEAGTQAARACQRGTRGRAGFWAVYGLCADRNCKVAGDYRETNDDEARKTSCCFVYAGSFFRRIGAATRSAQIQPGRRSDATDREQHAGHTRNQDLCRQPVQGRCRHRHNRGAEIAAPGRGHDAEQQSRSQRSGKDFGAVHSGPQRHPHRCSPAYDGEGLMPLGQLVKEGVLINLPNKGPNSVVTMKDIEESGVELGPNRIPVIHTGFTEKTW